MNTRWVKSDPVKIHVEYFKNSWLDENTKIWPDAIEIQKKEIDIIFLNIWLEVW